VTDREQDLDDALDEIRAEHGWAWEVITDALPERSTK